MPNQGGGVNRSNVMAEKNNNRSTPTTTTSSDENNNSSTTPPSNNIWIGNLSIETSDEDLTELFSKFGEIETVTNYSSRNYAFLYFKRLEDARAAKDALQNALLHGNSIRIEFARPAKPAKHLWVGGIGSSVTKEQLESAFLKFGKIEDFKFLRDRNSALIDYHRLEDAATALKNMNGRRLGGEQMRVDYLRSQPSRRENWSDVNDSRDGHFNNRGTGPPGQYLTPPDAPSQFGNKRPLPSQHSGGRREGQPSKILWVGYPPSVQIDEQMLHNAMILFGEIERIKSFPSRHYSFVEFRSVDEAGRAKDGLQGRLFNDPRIHIMFSSSGLAPPKDSAGFFNGGKGPGSDMLFNDPPFGPGPMEFLGHNRPMVPNNFAGLLPPPNMPMRPFAPQGGLDQILSRPELFNELAGLLHNIQEANPNSPLGQNWRRPSPAPGLGSLPPTRPLSGPWDGSDPKLFQRESKRSRVDGPSPISDNSPYPARMIDDQRMGDQFFGYEPQLDRGVVASIAQGPSHHSPLGMRVPSGGASGHAVPDNDLCWRGIIAKGGTPVCHARCVPIGEGLGSQLPDIVNCSARTGLDMLEKHYTEASGFEIVFFLPDSEEDFASYTEFLRYLGAKNRAGVAKFDDGTTLFLVPPSDFLTKVLNVSGPERLYGVVLKLPLQKPSATLQQQQPIPSSQYIDRHQLPPLQNDYGLLPPKDDQVLQMDYSRVSNERALSQLSRPPLPPNEEPLPTRSVPQDYASNPGSISQSGVSLTPELIATLASLLPTSTQSLSSTSGQLPLRSSMVAPTAFPDSEKTTLSQGWRQGHQANFTSTANHSKEELAVNHSQQLGYQFNTQQPSASQFPTYGNVADRDDTSGQAILSNSQIQNPAQHVTQQGASSSRPTNNFLTPHGGQFTVPQQANQQFQSDASLHSQKSYGTATDSTGFFHSPVLQQPKSSVTTSSQLQETNRSQSLLGVPSVNDNRSTVLPTQLQKLQSALSGAGQGAADGEADKNQRYQSTLQFAASLLLQIQQQQQQQGNNQAANGSGNQQ